MMPIASLIFAGQPQRLNSPALASLLANPRGKTVASAKTANIEEPIDFAKESLVLSLPYFCLFLHSRKLVA